MAEENQIITTGVWKISTGGLWLRVVDDTIELSPIEGEDGDHFSKWRLDYNDAEHGNSYIITNVATGINAWAAPPKRILVEAGEATKWEITPTGNGLQHIQWPNENHYWTGGVPVSGPVILKGLTGQPTQLWKFKWVGDF
ncbi:hypothetical protein AGABI2DRAFT_191025 [Agaricus bisporus var. bisporus H97]|uniref:hypothetical protein n=1 Tax=Agaricus bisporus var. bisporus (strain H97 / ATCC MYA-4626 / FGSC 10389) TaxID=936046 RepID=UPI00029F7DCB|nr:hypothetical protein AGABI2DRAFT_191025 [Agaricus bisporus var. bisporus H97]EKV48811.1 hypothetical protein AGABI2DRAFT_191025 [Agaricus bisporus var. bisporus H97]